MFKYHRLSLLGHRVSDTMEMNSLNVAFKRILFSIFRNNCYGIVLYFEFQDVNVLLTSQPGRKKFLMKFGMSDNCLCSQFIKRLQRVQNKLAPVILSASLTIGAIHKLQRLYWLFNSNIQYRIRYKVSSLAQ